MNTPRYTSIFTPFLLLLALALPALGTPPNTAVLDGRPVEYDATDLRGSSDLGVGSFGGNNFLTNLFVTWDEENLYIALQGSAEAPGNKMAVLIDVDPGSGTGASTTTNWVSPADPVTYLTYNEVGWQVPTNGAATPFGLDYMIASEGFFNNIVRVLYDGYDAPGTNNTESLFDSGNGSIPNGTDVDMAAQEDGSSCDLKGVEAKIPWSTLYDTNLLDRFGIVGAGEVVPTGAVLRVFANIHNNNPSDAVSSTDIIPQQLSVLSVFTNGIWTTDNYVDVMVDGDNDGLPDVAVLDVNAPFIQIAQGITGKSIIYAQFNEDVIEATAEDPSNWDIDGLQPELVTLINPNGVLITASNALPASGTLVELRADGVQDAALNTRLVRSCFDPATSGIETAVTVRFVLQTASGMGLGSAGTPGYPGGASNYFINGGSPPLEFGFPPVISAPLGLDSGTLYFRDVTFPPASPTTVNYKYSAQLVATGTNNYEVVRFANWSDATRKITLNTIGAMMTVTDYLGAAGGPLRNSATETNPTANSILFSDPRRGDAGVRARKTVLFQLDLNNRDLRNVDRVLVQGSDPLRGFNANGNGIGDFAGNTLVGWDVGGIELFDDGTMGDTNSGDGIYSRRWSFTTTGKDSEFVPGTPNSLVGGTFSGPPPYSGGGWDDERSPKSFIYKFYTVSFAGGTTNWLDSPDNDIEVYFEDINTNSVIEPFVWDDEGLPLPPPSNSPTMMEIVITNGQTLALFMNEVTELQHGVQISPDLLNEWVDYGTRGTSLGAGDWQADVSGGGEVEHYRAFAGPPKPLQGVRWEPSILPATGGTLRIYYNQHSRALAGFRDVRWFGANPSGGAFVQDTMTFEGDGLWTIDLQVASNDNGHVQFLFVDPPPTIYDKNGGTSGSDYQAMIGGRASMSPDPAVQGQTVTITYDAVGGPLQDEPAVSIWQDFDGWEGGSWDGSLGEAAMSNVGVNSNLWETTFNVPSSALMTVNWVFKQPGPPGSSTFDNNNSRDWSAFIQQ